jgi:hypothetical protein
VQQKQDAQLTCAEICPLERRHLKRRLLVAGLVDATVRFYPEPGFAPKVYLKTPDAEGKTPFNVELPFEHGEDATGPYIYVTSFTGDLMFAW